MPFLGNTPSQGFTNSVTKDDFNPNGSTTAFTLSKASNTNNIEVYVGNVRQEPTSSYSVSGTTLTMTEAPATGTNFYVMHESGSSAISLTPAAGTSVPGAFSVSGALTTAGFTSTGIDDNATSTAITIDASENVGIGVVPEAWQAGWTAQQIGARSNTVYTSGGAFRTNNAYRDSVNSRWEYQATDQACMYELSDSGTHGFNVAPSGTADSAISWTNVMTIANNGQLSFGTYGGQAGAQISIAYDGHSARVGTVGRGLNLEAGITSTSDAIRFANPNGEVGRIITNGSSTGYNTSSDYRLKENVTYTWDATTRLKQLKPARFNFIVDETNTLVDGFLAHEAQEVVPESVHGTKDGMRNETDEEGNVTSVPDMQGIDQSKLVPLLVKTIQELEARITALEDA